MASGTVELHQIGEVCTTTSRDRRQLIWKGSSEAILVDLQCPDLRFEGGSWNPEFFSGPCGAIYASPAFAQGCLDNRLFFSGRRSERVPADFQPGRGRSSGKPALIDRKSFHITYDDGSLDHVLQFADVARPGIGLKQIEAPLVHGLEALPRFHPVTIQEVPQKKRDIFFSFPKRRHFNGKDIQPVE